MFLVSKSQPYGFQCEKQTKKTLPTLPIFRQAFFLLGRANILFFLLDQKEKKGFIGSGGYNLFQGMIFYTSPKSASTEQWASFDHFFRRSSKFSKFTTMG